MKTRVPLMDKEAHVLRGQLAATMKHHPDRVDEINQMRRKLKLNRAAAYLADLAAQEPALTKAELARLVRQLP